MDEPRKRKTSSISPTQLTLREMRKRGFKLVVVVEHYNSFTTRKEDLFGMFDVLCLKRGETCAVQTTSYDNISHRIKKLTEHENIGAVREAGWTILCQGWFQEAPNRPYTLKREVDLS